MRRQVSGYAGAGGSRGFTLLELMLAVCIFAVVVTVLFSSFWAGINAWEKGEQRIEFQQRMRAACELLYREISATYPYFLTPSQLDKHTNYAAFFGESNSLRFVSYANLHKRASGLCMLEFWVSEQGGLMLGEAAALAANKQDFDAVPLRSREHAREIIPDLHGLQFRYFDQKKEDEKGEWINNWDPVEKRGYMPKIIEVTLSFSDPRGETLRQQLYIPIMCGLQQQGGGLTGSGLTGGGPAMASKSMEKDSFLRQNQRGIALLLVLWIITLLAVICAEFSATMRMETHVAHNFRESEQAYYTAEAGINRAILEIMRTSHSASARSRASAEKTNPNNPDADDESEKDYWKAGGSYAFTIDNELRCQVEIEDESNKVDINSFLQEAKKNPTPLKQLLRKKVGLKGDKADMVADSLIDWRDTDNNITGTSGAEDDYYKGLDPPYLCRNGTIPVVEELLLVRGIDDQLLFGKRGRPEQKIELSQEDLDDILSGKAGQDQSPDIDIPEDDNDETDVRYLGLLDIFSALPADLGTGAKVNAKGDITVDINSATAQQMLLLNGMTPEIAAEIVQERNKRLFAGPGDRLPSFKNYFRWKDSITVSSTGSFSQKAVRITARGCAPDGLVCRRITCTVLLARNRYFFLSWKEKN